MFPFTVSPAVSVLSADLPVLAVPPSTSNYGLILLPALGVGRGAGGAALGEPRSPASLGQWDALLTRARCLRQAGLQLLQHVFVFYFALKIVITTLVLLVSIFK